MLPTPTANHYREQQRRQLVAVAQARRVWESMGSDFDSSWSRVGPRLALVVAAAQQGAAAEGAAYVAPTLTAQDVASAALASAVAEAFAGAYPVDPGPLGDLESLLYGSVVQARTSGGSVSQRLAAGRSWLDMAVQTQVADASRQAAGATIAATPRAGWTRMVNPPCCQRCAVIAGRFFKWNAGFQRHPRCDCRHVPTTAENWRTVATSVDPSDVKDLSEAQRQAIKDGADMAQVINSRRVAVTKGGYNQTRSADGMTTTAGARRGQTRLTPEGIYAVSATRDEAIERLIAHGYMR